MNIELHVIENGVDKGILPSYTSLSISPMFCDYGTIAFAYPKAGKRFGLLYGKTEVEIVPFINGVKQEALGGLVRETNGDDVEDAAVFEFSGVGYLSLLDEARVYPFLWPSHNRENPSWRFTDATAGAIMRGLIQAAQSRGTLPGITMAFSATNDSNGVPWNKQISIEVKPGVTVTAVLKNLYEQGMVEFEMNGRELRMYNQGAFSMDRTTGNEPLIFRRGRDLRDSPRKISSREMKTVMLAAGDEEAGLYHEEVDASAVAGLRRIEGYVSNGNVSDAGTLDVFTTFSLQQVSKPMMEKSHGLEFAHPRSPQPIRDFHVGDWAYSDVGNGLERLRIKQWVLSVDNSGKVSGSVVLNDLFAELTERLTKRIDGIVGGSTITGESRAEPVIPGEVIDGLAPATPQSLVLTSDAYMDDQGQTYAQITASWQQVTSNVDGTPASDIAGYKIFYRYQDAPSPDYRALLSAGAATTLSWSPVTPGVTVEVRVAAYDKAGNESPWSNPAKEVETGYDATPPEAPAAPLVDNYLGLLRVRVSGATASGAPRATDQRNIDVHASTVNNFTPSPATRIDSLSAAGGISYLAAAYGTTYYFKTVAIDHTGNESAPSAQASGSSTQVVGADIFDGAVGTQKLANLAVTNAKIGLLAVNDANIGSMNVGKLTAGVMSAEVTISGRFTTALTGARTEINALGLQKFGSDGTLLVSITGADALLTGRYRTAVSGRRIEMGSGGSVGVINFWAPDGARSEIGSFTGANVNTEAIRIGMVFENFSQFWGKMQLQEDEHINSWCKQHNIIVGGQTGSGGLTVSWASSKGSASSNELGETRRMEVDEKGGRFFLPYPGVSGGSSFAVIEQSGPSTVAYRFAIDDTGTTLANRSGQFQFRWFNTLDRAGFIRGLYATASPSLYLIRDSNYGTNIFYAEDSPGANPRVEVKDGGNSVHIPLWAGAFVVGSSEQLKTGIRNVDSADVVTKLRQLEPKHYRRKAVKARKPAGGLETDPAAPPVATGLADLAREETGLLAEQVAQVMPELVVTSPDGTPMIDLYATVSAVLVLAQQAHNRLDTLEKGPKK